MLDIVDLFRLQSSVVQCPLGSECRVGWILCNYGTGLRKITYSAWEEGGELWAGHYGVITGQAEIIIEG